MYCKGSLLLQLYKHLTQQLHPLPANISDSEKMISVFKKMPPLAAAGKATNILHQGFPDTSIVGAFSSNSQFRPRPVAVLRQLAPFSIQHIPLLQYTFCTPR